MSKIDEEYRKKPIKTQHTLADGTNIDTTIGDFNYWDGDIYYGSNKNYSWTLELKNVYDGSTLTNYTITDDNVQDVETIFQIWDDILVDNMLGYDSNGNKIKINIDFGFQDMISLGSVIAYASQSSVLSTKTVNGSKVFEHSYVFTKSGYTNMNTRFLDGYYGTPFDAREYDVNGNYGPVYLPRTGVNVTQNEFIRVMVHELGHIMMLVCTQGPGRYIYDSEGSGYQTMQNVPYVQYTDTNDSNKLKYYWGGPNARKYYRRYFENEALMGPPVEDMSGPYTIDGQSVYINRHWEESGTRDIPDENGNNISHPYLDRELMTPYHDGGSNGIPFSLICIGYLEDCGYAYVNKFKANHYPFNRSGITNEKTPEDILDLTTFYVRTNSTPSSDPFFVFSTTANGTALNTSAVNLPLQRELSYKFIRSESNSNTNHPFNVGTAWQTNGSSIAITSDGSGGVVSNALQTSSAASIVHGEELYFSVPSIYGWDNEELKYFCYIHPNLIKNFDLGAAPCFDASTKILCLRDDKEEQVLVSELKKGDLIVTYKHGALPIQKIGTATLLFNSDTDYRQTMYRLKKTDEMSDDLLVTGRHGILLDDWSTHITEESRTQTPHTTIDDKVVLSAGYSNMFEAEKEPQTHTIYHFALEGEQRRYGIYANGALMETWDNKSKDVKMSE
jgi:hypothetical protein